MKGLPIMLPVIILNMSSILCYWLYYQSYSYLFLGLGVFIAFSAVYLGISRQHEAGKLLSVVLFLFSLATLGILRTSPWGFTRQTDSSYDLQLTNLMVKTGRWSPGLGTGYSETEYSYNPALNLLTASLTEVSGINSVLIARFLFPLLAGALTVVFFYIAIRSAMGMKVAIVSAFVFCLDYMFVFFDVAYVHESLALVFYAMYLMVLLFVYFKTRLGVRFVLIGVLACFTTILSHPWSGYNLIVISTVFLILPVLYAHFCRAILHKEIIKERVKPLVRAALFTLMACAIIFSWLVFVEFNIFSGHIETLVSALNARAFAGGAASPTIAGYTLLEKVIIVLGLFVLAVFGTVELLHGLIRRKTVSDHDAFFDSWFIFSAVYLVIFSYASSKFVSLDIAKRCWVFAFFGLSPLMAKGIVRAANNLSARAGGLSAHKMRLPRFAPHLIALVLILPLFACVLQAPLAVHDPSYQLPDSSYYNVALWLKDYAQNKSIVIDNYSEQVLVPYGNLTNFSYPKVISNSLNNQTGIILYQSKNALYVAPESVNVIVFNRQIAKAYDWYPGASANPSALDQSPVRNRILDSPSLTIFVKGHN